MGISRTGLEMETKAKPLRFITCGNVDDGKSTLIGRLLWDTKSVKLDHAKTIAADSVRLADAETHPDFANLLDGLQAEREQGITIDVAYRCFSSTKRTFIVADTPGHEQYTRNMVTGASNADLAVLLVDAQSGVTEQTRRHAYIAYSMGIRQVVFAVNKMDLVDYNHDRFYVIEGQIRDICKWMQFKKTTIIPVAAVHGYNVVTGGAEPLRWYMGPTLLEALENAEVSDTSNLGFRMCVQRISRPNESFRGYQGTIHGGSLKKGQSVIVQPSQLTATVKSIQSFDGEIDEAVAGDAVTVELDRKIDIARGDYIVDAGLPLQSANRILAKLMILDDRGLDPAKRYWLKTQSHKRKVSVVPMRRMDLSSGEWIDNLDTSVNSITETEIRFDAPYFFDEYAFSRETGSFILVDPDDFSTVAGGTVLKKQVEHNLEIADQDAMVHISLPADLARQLLLTSVAQKRMNEIRLEDGPDRPFEPGFLKALKAQGIDGLKGL